MNVSDAVLIACIVAIPPTLTSTAAVIVAWRGADRVDSIGRKVEMVETKVEEVHKATNSMKDALVATTRSDALQQGRAEGIQEQKATQTKGK